MLLGFIGLTLYVTCFGLPATKKPRTDQFNKDVTRVSGFVHSVRPSNTCQISGFKLLKDEYNEFPFIQPPHCGTQSLFSNTHRLISHKVWMDNGRLRIKQMSNYTEETFQCSLFPIIRMDEYKSVYGTPINHVQDGDRPGWPSFMVLCQPRNNLIMLSPIRWDQNTFKQQERHFVCGSMPPIDVEARPHYSHPVFNVLLLGLDSISRLAADRYLPKTMKWLRNQVNAEIMDFYNIIGDGTTANLLALLTGRFEHELPEGRKSHVSESKRFHSSEETVLDNYPWLWNDFLEVEGYATHFIEDSPKWGTFQHRLVGFGIKRAPTDSYGRPCLLMATQEEQRYGKVLGCITSRYTHHVLLESMTEFFLTYAARPRFSLTFLSEMIHENSAYASLLDDDLEGILKRIHTDDFGSDIDSVHNSSPFANTLVILFADHGPRMGPTRLTVQGKMEERSPLLSFYLPRRFTRTWPEARAALRKNKNRLTTLFDVYATLKHLLQLQQNKSEYLHRSSSAPSDRGRSLFYELPANRSCADAHIMPHWCMCLSWYPIKPRLEWIAKLFYSVWPRWLEHAAQYTVNELNTRIMKARQSDPDGIKCNNISVNKILSAEQALPPREMMNFIGSMDPDGRVPEFASKNHQHSMWRSELDDETRSQLIRLLFLTKLNDAHFEATVHVIRNPSQNKFHLISLSRLDIYESKVWCLPTTKWSELRHFCLCTPN